MAPSKAPEQSSHPPSRTRTPSPPRHRATPAPKVGASRVASPYRVERSRPIRTQSRSKSRSPVGEVRLGNHSISVSRHSARPRRDPSPRENDYRKVLPRRSRSPPPRSVRRDPSRASRAGPSDYRGRDRRSPPRRRSYSPVSPPRKRTPPRTPPRPARRRTPSPPSRSRSRSPTHTPPPKRHVLPPLRSPTRPPPPPPPTGPRIRAIPPQQPQTQPPDADGDISMQDLPSADRAPSPAPITEFVSSSRRTPSPAPTSAPAPAPISAAASVSPQQLASTVPNSPPTRTTAVPSLPPKPDLEPERRPAHPRRRSRSPPTGPRHHVPTPSNRSPAQGPHGGPNLPPRPDWNRRSTAHGGARAAEPLVPAAAPEPAGFQPVIPPYQPKQRVTAGIEAEVRPRRCRPSCCII